MTIDELAKLIEKIARKLELPVVKVCTVTEDRSLNLGTKRPPRAAPIIEPQVYIEIQKEGCMALGNATVKLKEVQGLAIHRAVDFIIVHLWDAALEAGFDFNEPAERNHWRERMSEARKATLSPTAEPTAEVRENLK